MGKIISQRERVTGIEYYHDYRWNNDINAGFSFDCDAEGKLLEGDKAMSEAGKENYNNCITGAYDVTYYGLKSRKWSYVNDAVLKCSCGCEVHLSRFTNTCDDCNADYNMSGQLLAPREQWGEETGEHWSDCY